MNERDAIEQAYKNGFEAGVKEFAERLNGRAFHDMNDGEAIVCCCDIDSLVAELTANNESSKQRKEDEGK